MNRIVHRSENRPLIFLVVVMSVGRDNKRTVPYMGDTPEDFDEEAANLNGDDRIDVADIVLLNKLLGQNPSSLP